MCFLWLLHWLPQFFWQPFTYRCSLSYSLFTSYVTYFTWLNIYHPYIDISQISYLHPTPLSRFIFKLVLLPSSEGTGIALPSHLAQSDFSSLFIHSVTKTWGFYLIMFLKPIHFSLFSARWPLSFPWAMVTASRVGSASKFVSLLISSPHTTTTVIFKNCLHIHAVSLL